MPALPSVSVTELSTLHGEGAVILDVREDAELAICALEGALHIPMQQVPVRWHELPTDAPIYCLCHHGMRSAMVAQFLRERDLDAINVSGGIEAWACQVEPDMTRY
ncbi:MAG: rhodanese-like domain-containing protein [Planctomycetota bacterium]|jgi:rhodanese-related sulfurtransferase|nr:rhodanese-like domain-containing protein [Planctomycetota bacterium]